MSHLLHKAQPIVSDGVKTLHDITMNKSDLSYVEFCLIELQAGESYTGVLGKQEVCVVAVSGQITVTDGKQTFENIGTRQSVFEKIPTDSVYITNDKTFTVTSTSQAKVALCYSPSDNPLPTKLIKACDLTPEKRGKGQNQRLVHTILSDTDTCANSLLVVEVFTESGNSSSYPPHKHDQDNLPHESFLEETYYHEIHPPQGFVFQRVYTDDHSLDETMSVGHSDVVVVPKGYHPVAVPAGYTSYYLNVMAGPKKIWKFYNDPDHEWILEAP